MTPLLREVSRTRSIKVKAPALALLGAIATLSAGCATIVHGGPREVPVTSTPPGATVTIYDRNGQQVMKQTTPFTASLRPKYAYFKGQQYRVVFEMPGYQPSEVQLRSSISGWYFANIVFGGILGMVIVDPNTGAMYNLMPNKIDQPLKPQATANLP
jgi:hypothetical protein